MLPKFIIKFQKQKEYEEMINKSRKNIYAINAQKDIRN